MLTSGKNWRFFVPRDLEIWWMTLKNKRAPLLYYIKLCAAFQSHWHIQTGVTVWKYNSGQNWRFLSRVTLKIDLRYDLEQGKSEGFDSCDRPSNLAQIWSKSDFSACVTLKFDRWPRKMIGHLFHTTSSFVHHFKSIGEFKPKLQSGNAQFGSK